MAVLKIGFDPSFPESFEAILKIKSHLLSMLVQQHCIFSFFALEVLFKLNRNQKQNRRLKYL